ncbi:MAG: Ig-like domain-containing protein [Muribaculaceae bacterium]|nr:Ig-like domain-containing protein [Muribaculaceae bacterium]
MNSLHNLSPMRLLLVVAAALLLVACATIGRPEGGARDVTPPQYVRSQPADGELNVNRKKINIFFDENVTLDNASQKVVVSPPQKNQPIISSNGRRVTVELRDTLRDSTTYTIDFADAIKDLNEGNILDGFAMAFSTGPYIDSLAISGMVFEARTLEPAQGMIVGVYSNFTDTTLTTTPFDRVTKTNQLGQFRIRNMAPGTYHVFAVNDLNHDYHWDRSEDIAFLNTTIVPTTEPITLNDTISPDSIVTYQAYRTLPNDILLTWFNEKYTPSYLVKNERPDRKRLYIEMSTPQDSLPEIKVVGSEFDGRNLRELSVLDYTQGRDSITYWLTDTVLMKNDSLRMQVSYLKTDSLGKLVLNTDTLKFNLRAQRNKKKKEEKKKDDEVADSLQSVKIEFMPLKIDVANTQDLNKDILLSADIPIARIDSAAVRMEKMVDTLWVAVDPPEVKRRAEHNPREYLISCKWEPGTKYRLSVDSASVHDIYGLFNAPVKKEFTTLKEEDYSALFFKVDGLGGQPAIVELLQSDRPIAEASVGKDGAASFTYLKPGSYYARLYIDSNDNKKWDTGCIADSLQPEEVYYYPKKLNLKKNWDVEQVWNIYDTPVDQQKPNDIKKNKPKVPAGQKNAEAEEEDTEDNEWDTMQNDPFFLNRNGNNTRDTLHNQNNLYY